MKLYTVPKMMNIDYIVEFVINYVFNDTIEIISDHKLTQINFIKSFHIIPFN